MADSVYVDLSPVIREVQHVASRVESVSNALSESNDAIRRIDKEVVDVRNTVEHLRSRFQDMMNNQNKSYAATEIVRIRQELQAKFGHYEAVRKNMIGILQANDLSLVKEETISSCSEELMLAAPGYWLAPALVALASWISDNPSLAKRAVQESIKRDAEKTYLLFALICRRAGRLDASSQWLGRYFELQNAHNMKSTVVNMLDAYSNHLFGNSRDAVCEDSINNWMREVKQVTGFMDEQVKQWVGFFDSYRASELHEEFTFFKNTCEEAEKFLYAYDCVDNMHRILGMFVDIMSAEEDEKSLIQAIDECLYNLVKNFDKEEEPLKNEEKMNSLIISFGGDEYRAREVFRTQIAPKDKVVNFADQLSRAAFEPQKYGVSATFRKTSLKLLEKEKIISTSFKKYANDTRQSIPKELTFHLNDWRAKIKCDEGDKLPSVQNIVKSYGQHVDKKVKEEQDAIKQVSVPGVIIGALSLILMIVCSVFATENAAAAVFAVLFAIGVVVGVVFVLKKLHDVKKRKEQIFEEGESLKSNGTMIIEKAYQEFMTIREFLMSDVNQYSSENYQIESLK